MKNKIIAEVGSVHDGSFGNAMCLIAASINAGADIVKFQLHIFDEESLPDAPNPPYFKNESRKNYFERTAFSESQWIELKKYTEGLDREFLVSPFSIAAVEFLEKIDVSSYKVPSGEISNIPLLERLAETKKTIILSSGMSSWQELDRAVKIFEKKCNLILMQCTSIYPCPVDKVGLNVIKEISSRYSCIVGFSDHTLGYSASIAAATMGARVIEKHVTFSKDMYGSDAPHSMDMIEFQLFCKNLKEVWKILDSDVDKDDISIHSDTKKIFEKSIVSAFEIGKNQTINSAMLSFKKPGNGIPAKEYKKLIGKKINKSVDSNHQFAWGDFE